MDNQIVNVDLGSDFEDGVEKKVAINITLTNRSKEQGLGHALSNLDLGFPISNDWPYGEDIELSTLVVLAYKLKLKIIIKDIELQPLC
ncbi:MAG TPA: hypothetical protein PLP05_00380 [Sedimentisphaerales bacterium]|nr:hypothetical protein [Sedimentisphaerales bacterium]